MPAIVRPDDLGSMFDDVDRRLRALERINQLNNAGVQVTPSAGSVVAGKGFVILGPDGKERVRLGATDTDATPAATAALYGLSVKDTQATPHVRFQAGQIVNALGATDYGAAAYDASGTVIWDSTGLRQVASRIGGNSSPSLAAQGFTTTATNLPSSSSTFTLARTGSVLILSQANFYTSGGTASYGFFRLSVLNGASSQVATSLPVVHTNGSGVSGGSPYILIQNFAADTYTVWMQYWLDAGATTTWTLYSGQWDAFLMGG